MHTSAQPHELAIVYQLLQESAQWLQNKNLTQWNIWLNPDTAPSHLRKWIEDSFAKNEFFFVKDEKFDENAHIPYPNVRAMYRLMYQDDMFWAGNTQKAGYIHSFVVRKPYKGENLGGKILSEITQQLQKNNIFLLRLDCNASNPVLCAYYEKQGFVKVGEKMMEWGINNLYEKNFMG